jgi:hypothetical protein
VVRLIVEAVARRAKSSRAVNIMRIVELVVGLGIEQGPIFPVLGRCG